VWLPAQLAKLTDREGAFAQTLLQAISNSLYRNVPLKPRLATFVAPIWEKLPLRDEVAEIDVPLDQLNFFLYERPWLDRRRRTLRGVQEAISAIVGGAPLEAKVVSSRYGNGLRDLEGVAVTPLLDMLTQYAEAVDEADAAAVE